ncbi:MAG: DUF4440 domain-containing protein [Saprospiraceae bacterium]
MKISYILFGLFLTASAYAQPLSSPDAVYARMSKAYQTLDAELIKSIYRSDAQYLSPQADIRQGVDTFIGDFSKMFADAEAKDHTLDIQFAIQNRRQLNKKTVLDVGIYILTYTLADGTSSISKGKFTTVLEKDKKAGWQFTLDTYNNLPRPPQVEPASSRMPESIIRDNIKQFSKDLMAGNFAAVVASYTEDGKIFPNHTKILGGLAAIGDYWTPASDNPNRIVFHEIIPESITINGRQAVDYGYYRGKTRNGKGEESAWQGKYIIIWKEVELGVWKIELDIWNNVRNAADLPAND